MVVLCIIAGLVLLDAGVRIFLQWRIATTVEEVLPPGVTGDVEARVDGFSALWQVAHGEYEHVELRADELMVLGVPIAARVDGYGVRLGGDGPVPVPEVDELVGELRISQDSLNRLVPIPGATGGVELGEESIAYSTTMSLLGFDVDVNIEATVGMQGDRLVIQATRLEVTGGALGFDATDLLGDATTIAVPLCTASYLPPGIHLQAVDVSTTGVTVSITANRITLDEETLASRGTCR